ncbi:MULTISPECIES: hypothetical protein [unclassified Cellulophaga]|uniref:hypothetical protein n=1 Tax=unclassified Cellulophaga TaxID=2634405 RepID=UPI0026E35A06|nr:MULTISPECIES: hypothetical protein [unclassified Cellulophaga]MDO6491635.1 hypothetical protein [Cellulophaga sp. 2_MG-2023]MDO6493512.1 hypothetical protein [Cellulophaga sp. 3_MG-2023]
MKKVNIMLVCFLALNFFSCSSDDDSSTKNNDAEINAQEDEPLEINSVTSGFIIEGATKKTGTLTPTGGLEFTMDYSKQSAFQKKGFEIEFNSASDYTGAYIQLKDENGMADSYFDVPRDEIYVSGKGEQTKKNRNFLKGKSAGKENDAIIEVNLAETVTAGTFCYVICLYDAQGNISEPTEVCVTIEAWGGNSDLVGSWDYTKQIENGKEFKVKEEDCDSDTSTICNEEYSVDECHKINFINIKFNNDGTFEMNNSQTEKYLNNQESQANCGVVYQESSYTYNAKGKWAYNEEENRITIVNFSDVYDYGDEIDAETYENGELGLDGPLEISDSNLKITESDSYDGVEIDVYEYFFEKE